MKKEVMIYTDGASRGNPGKGGWGVIIMTEKEVVELAGRKELATNNQMELEATIEALRFASKKYKDSLLVLHSDSAYVLGGLESWLDGWVRNNWITSTKKPVENKAQWQTLLKLRDELGRNLHLVKVKGHSGHEFNERCDELAVAAALEQPLSLYKGSYTTYIGTLTEKPKKVASVKKTSIARKSKEAYSYVSFVGGKVYVDKTWTSCEKRVKGVKGAKYKKVSSKKEETELVQDYTLESLL